MPHKLGNLWLQITDYDALLDAWREVRSGKGHKPVGIRLDSGDLAYLSVRAAKMLGVGRATLYRFFDRESGGGDEG